MSDSIIERLGEEILLMSGPMSARMHQMGADPGGCVSQGIVEHPDVYRDLVREYFRVGCHIVAGAASNLNRISPAKFGRAGRELR